MAFPLRHACVCSIYDTPRQSEFWGLGYAQYTPQYPLVPLRQPSMQDQLRVVHTCTNLGATPSGMGVPDLRCAYPTGNSQRSCMLRRILLKVERGLRRRVCQLRSCLHIPGADQSSASSIPLSNAFLAIGTELTNLYESLLLLS